MITGGVDLASQDAKTAACVVDWSDQRAKVSKLTVGVDDKEIEAIWARVDKMGIDVPLGWPVAFADAMTMHSRGGSWPANYQHADLTDYRLRRTDVWVWKNLKMSPPLSVSTDRIALPAMRAAALLSRLPTPGARDGSGVVVEVYPAAALHRWGFPSRQYKRKENIDARRELVGRFLSETNSWLAVETRDVDLCIESDDAFDALVAALVARAAAVGLVEPTPREHLDFARREGWIAVPVEASLARLAAG